MLQEIELGSSGLRAPQIGFGCSALLGRCGRTDSLRALSAAWDEGIRFFDTARAYGYGECEALLGEFLRGRREQAVICTKFGIMAARQPAWKGVAKSVARKILAIAPAAHSMLQKRAGSQFSSNQFTIPVLQRSIEESLRQLGTDHVDMLLLHAAPASVLDQDDLLEAMGRLVEAGKVRIAGLSAEPEVVELAMERKTYPLRAMQFPCSVFGISAAGKMAQHCNGDCVLVANQPFGGSARAQQCRTILNALADKNDLSAGLREKLRSKEDNLLADVVLNAILRDTGIHVVIPSMMNLKHIQSNVRAVTHSLFDSGEIAQIRHALCAGDTINA
jgi:aryl-alcohol dehydrogenase-like predicted oxidoreductase